MKEVKFYRCVLCGTVVNNWDIETGKGCPHCSGRTVRPTNLNLLEKLIQIIKHPKVWRWGDDI